MKDYLKVHPWKIIEEGFHAEYNKVTESIFSLGNGRLGQRANFEEHYSGETLLGNYVGGVYYPDKTIVGWWKNGYPDYYAKVLNSANWNILDILINGEQLDLAKQKVLNFRRTLDMQKGILTRTCKVEMADGTIIQINAERINSLANKEVCLIQYDLKVVKGIGTIKVDSKIDFDVRNEDSNYEENFWHKYQAHTKNGVPVISAETKKTAFQVTLAQHTTWTINGDAVAQDQLPVDEDTMVSEQFYTTIREGDTLRINKFVSILSSLNHDKEVLERKAAELVKTAKNEGFQYYRTKQIEIWASKWKDIDITIEGDDAAQQGIRFNIFQLHQTYSGDDDRLNIGPKGFTGERYGGCTYWDTEAYCIPFYQSTADESVAEALLIYRYKQLGKAIENAEKLGFTDGAALYPMVTMNGEECHNEWEITFEEIHRNGAIAYAIFDYIRYTGKDDYLSKYGLEVLIGISRFWAQRVHFSERRKKYVMMGVTGPNEYENNVNNNWYTNYIATWTLKYTLEALAKVEASDNVAYGTAIAKTRFNFDDETAYWKTVIDNMYYPYDEELNVFLQQDNYLDKEQVLVKDLKTTDLPLNQNWSWDRILRSCFIKQADVLQGIFFFEDEFDQETIRRNFLFYEPRTVHESSLSPCIHAILASKLGMDEKAYEMYLRTARLDLNDYNNDTEDGLHITSMAGTWLSIVKGFGGMKVVNDTLTFEPSLPKEWEAFSFKIKFRGGVIDVRINKEGIKVENLSEVQVPVSISHDHQLIEAKAVALFDH